MPIIYTNKEAYQEYLQYLKSHGEDASDKLRRLNADQKAFYAKMNLMCLLGILCCLLAIPFTM